MTFYSLYGNFLMVQNFLQALQTPNLSGSLKEATLGFTAPI